MRQGWQAEFLLNAAEALVPPRRRINDQTLLREEGEAVTDKHTPPFDAHEIAPTEGAPSESFHPGHVGWGALAEEAREEVLTLFPALDGTNFDPYGPVARRTLAANAAKVAMTTRVALR